MSSEVIKDSVFEKYCEEIAHNFVQTMVFMDDQAAYDTPSVPEQKTETPPKGIADRRPLQVSSKSEEGSKSSSENTQSHPLNVADILESSMRSGLVCSIHKPQNDEDFKLENLKAVVTADIVCFDWIMKPDDNGETTKNLIANIIQEDVKVGGRHRLISIYTFKHELAAILNEVKGKLSESGVDSHFDAEHMSLTGDHFRILGLLKEGGTQLKEYQVSAKSLPEKLIKEFSNFNQGLIPNLTMASIATLRESTAHLLAKLNADLDGPFLTHKSLLPNTEDATNYASEIISSELKSIVNKHRISDDLLSNQLIASYIEDKAPISLKFVDPKGDTKTVAIDPNLLSKLVIDGVRNVDDVDIESIDFGLGNDTERGEVCSLVSKSMSSFLTESYEESFKNNLEFLRITTIAADQTSQVYMDESHGGHGKKPMLTLGAIVKQHSSYFLCLQPSCDSVRLDRSGSAFWFLKLKKNNDKPSLVISYEGELVGLRYSHRIKESKLIEFKRTDANAGGVLAERENGKLIFTSKGEDQKKYQWIADLKPDIARKIGQELANQYSRIGLDEFELSRMGWEFSG